MNLANSSSAAPIFFGGDLPSSPWADSFSSPKAMEYMTNHPWIKVWNEYDIELYLQKHSSQKALKSIQAARDNAGSPFSTNTVETALDALSKTPSNNLTSLAWNTYFSLTSEPASPQLDALRKQYYVEIGYILLASDWAQNPYKISQPIQIGPSLNYILSNEDHFLLFDNTDGSLLIAVARKGDHAQLLIAPTSFFSVGLSSPETWENNGIRSDPTVIPGAFSDNPPLREAYSYNPIANGIVFSNLNGITKSYKLIKGNLFVEIESNKGYNTNIPLVLDPNWKFMPTYRSFLNRLIGKTPIQIESNIPLKQTWFFDSINLLDRSEDPDMEYPPSHFLPIPTGKVELNIPAGKQVQITINLKSKD
jgi:hypothetical protein